MHTQEKLRRALIVRTCAGIPLVGTRAITALEEAEFAGEIRSFRLTARRLWLIFPLLFLLWLGSMTVFPEVSPAQNLGMGLGLGVFSLLLVTAYDSGRRAKSLSKDLASGIVLIFGSGPNWPGSQMEGGWSPELESERILLGNKILEVLEFSDRLILINGERPPRWTRASTYRIHPANNPGTLGH